MKQCFKYGLLVVLALLLHSVMMKSVDGVHTSVSINQKACFVSPTHVVSHSLDRFYLYCVAITCEIGHADVSHIPTDKSFARHFSRFREHKFSFNHFSDYLVHPPIYSFSDSIKYYIYGLRKILV